MEDLFADFVHFLKTNDIEDGMASPGDAILQKIVADRVNLLELAAIYLKNMDHHRFVDNLTNIINRVDYEDVYPVGQLIVRHAIQTGNLNIQDSCLKTIDSWAVDGHGDEFLDLLDNLNYECNFLAKYGTEIACSIRQMQQEKNVERGIVKCYIIKGEILPESIYGEIIQDPDFQEKEFVVTYLCSCFKCGRLAITGMLTHSPKCNCTDVKLCKNFICSDCLEKTGGTP